MYPEFSQFLFHPEVDAFKDIPRLLGETIGNEEVVPEQCPSFTEQWGEPWPATTSTQTNKEVIGHASYMTSPPSSQAAAVVDSLRLTDQELDGILELKGEI